MEPSGAHSSDAFKTSSMPIEEMYSRITRLSDLIPHISKLVRIHPNDRDEIYEILTYLGPQDLNSIIQSYQFDTDCYMLKELSEKLEYHNNRYRDNIMFSPTFKAMVKRSEKIIHSACLKKKSLRDFCELRLEILQKCHKDLKGHLGHDYIIANASNSKKLVSIIRAVNPSTYELIENTDPNDEFDLIPLALKALQDNPENLDLKELETYIAELENVFEAISADRALEGQESTCIVVEGACASSLQIDNRQI